VLLDVQDIVSTTIVRHNHSTSLMWNVRQVYQEVIV